MRKLLLVLAFVAGIAPCASAAQATLNDQAVLPTDAGFIQRVRTAMVAAAIAISSESAGTAQHGSRIELVVKILNAPDQWKQLFAYAVATDLTVSNGPTVTGTVALVPNGCTAAATAPWPLCTGGAATGNLQVQAALATDVAINNAVSGMWNAFFQH